MSNTLNQLKNLDAAEEKNTEKDQIVSTGTKTIFISGCVQDRGTCTGGHLDLNTLWTSLLLWSVWSVCDHKGGVFQSLRCVSGSVCRRSGCCLNTSAVDLYWAHVPASGKASVVCLTLYPSENPQKGPFPPPAALNADTSSVIILWNEKSHVTVVVMLIALAFSTQRATMEKTGSTQSKVIKSKMFLNELVLSVAAAFESTGLLRFCCGEMERRTSGPDRMFTSKPLQLLSEEAFDCETVRLKQIFQPLRWGIYDLPVLNVMFGAWHVMDILPHVTFGESLQLSLYN